MLKSSSTDSNMFMHMDRNTCLYSSTDRKNYYHSLKDPLCAVSVVQPLICSSEAIFVVHHTILEFGGFLHVIQEHEIFLDMCVVCDICTPIRHRGTTNLLDLICNMELILYICCIKMI
jgi:hypothetical protein